MRFTTEEEQLLERICKKHQVKVEHLQELIKTEIEYSLKPAARRQAFFTNMQSKIDEWVEMEED